MNMRGTSGGEGEHRGRFALVVTAAAAAIFVYQLFIPPPAGLADNGDFSRIMGAVGLQYTAGNRQDLYFNYFVPTYKFESSDEWDALVFTSENVLVLGAMAITRLGSRSGLFDVRVLAALRLTLFLPAVWLLLRQSARLSRATRIVAALLLLLVFCDVGYAVYFNSLYGEAESFVFLFLTVAAALRLAEQPASRARWAAWLAASVLFAGAKPQNHLLGIPLAAYGFWIAFRAVGRPGRRLLAGPVALGLISALLVWSTPRWIVRYSLYNAVFYELLKYSPAPRADLLQLDLNPDLEKYRGTNTYSPDAPLEDPGFESAFFNRMGAAKLMRFYLRHPSRLAAVAQRTAPGAFCLRPSYLGNFEKSYGLAPGAQSRRFQFWSKLRESAAPRSLWFVAVFFAVNGMAALAVYVKSGSGYLRAAMVFHLMLAAMAIEQLLLAGIMCGQYELVKHLFLFNLLFDWCVCADAVLLAAGLSTLRWRGVCRHARLSSSNGRLFLRHSFPQREGNDIHQQDQ
jgi:hypothetical protein